MKSLDYARYALSSCAAAALLTGCGGSQLPIGAPGAMPVSRPPGALQEVTNSTPLVDVINGRIAQGSEYQSLYSFRGSPDGAAPVGDLVYVNRALYGVTQGGGAVCNCGTVFTITKTGQEQVLYSFKGFPDGETPQGGLTAFSGALYGTTFNGGSGGGRKCSLHSGCGIVFQIDASWQESVFYAFHGGRDGANPSGALLALGGKLYGTTNGDLTGRGTVFALSTPGHQQVLYRFKGSGDGAYPLGNLVAVKGYLYGTTSGGGAANVGTVFKMSLTGHEQIIHSFNPSEGDRPYSGLVALNGTLYGTSSTDGAYKRGAVFSITPSGQFHVVHSFLGSGKGDGAHPEAVPIVVNGMLYGTTLKGGEHGKGTIYELSPSGKESILHSFGPLPNGRYPLGPLRFVSGMLYGTTFQGGIYGQLGAGTVFVVRL
jgi:uncharacterized repeat protein (TIGR03803 family)